MLPLRQISPDESILDSLRLLQQAVDREPTYALQVDAAKTQWVRQNRPSNQTFDEIKQLLDAMCRGGRRCCYCEDSLADEVEHIWPKALYPDLTFSWLNYLYACGPCNVKKLARFALFVTPASTLTHVGRKRKDPVVQPPYGEPVFIDPRHEDPMDFLMLDLRGTYRLLAKHGLSARDRKRADYTRQVLPLNSDPLRNQRKNACDSYRALLTEYAAEKQRGATAQQLRRRRNALLRRDHPTVWREMQRQQSLISELQRLFQSVPEALTW